LLGQANPSKPSQAKPSNAKQSQAKPGKAKQSRAKPSKAKQSKAKQSQASIQFQFQSMVEHNRISASFPHDSAFFQLQGLITFKVDK
jgi:hypothetical protein